MEWGVFSENEFEVTVMFTKCNHVFTVTDVVIYLDALGLSHFPMYFVSEQFEESDAKGCIDVACEGSPV